MNNLVSDATFNADHLVRLPDDWPIGMRVRIEAEPLTGDAVADQYQPRTELGRKLIELRRAYALGGGKLLEWDEIDEEARERRGGVSDV